MKPITPALALILVVAGASPASFAASGAGYQAATIRYRLTITLRIDGHEVSGSSVQELGLFEGALRPPLVPSRVGTGVRGEALLMDLGPLGGLIVPIEQRGADLPYEAVIFWACSALKREESVLQYADRVRASFTDCEIPAYAMPMLVAIPDLRSAEGLVRVTADNMSELFGVPMR